MPETEPAPRLTLRETMPFRVTNLTEGAPDNTGYKPLVVEGVFQAYDRLNANKRIYPKALWERLLKSDELQTALERRRMLGEVDHPADWKMSLARSSHVITNLRMDEQGNIIGRAEVLGTPQGKVVRSILEAGCEFGISSRGQGSTHKNNEGHEIVSDDFKLETFDFVADPSTANAYPKMVRETIEREARELQPYSCQQSSSTPKGETMDALREFHFIEQEAQGLLEESKADPVTRLFLRKQVEEKLVKLTEMRQKQPELEAVISPLLAQLQKRHVDLSPHAKPLKEETVGMGGPIGPAGDILPDMSNVPDYSDGEVEFAVPPLGPEVAGQVQGSAESRFAQIEQLFNVDWQAPDRSGMYEFDASQLKEGEFETLSGGPGSTGGPGGIGAGGSSHGNDYGDDDNDDESSCDGCEGGCCKHCGHCNSGGGGGRYETRSSHEVIDRQIESFLREG